MIFVKISEKISIFLTQRKPFKLNMSFLKKIFESSKSKKKQEKGHRLGDATESTVPRQLPVAPVSLSSNNEAALKAASAALQRVQSKTNPNMTRPSSSRAAVQNEMSTDERELQRALELKEHYFGKAVITWIRELRHT